MNKGLRQFLVFFILVCIVVLSVLVVQVFILGEKVASEASLPMLIESESPSPEPSESESEPTVETAPDASQEVSPPEESPTEVSPPEQSPSEEPEVTASAPPPSDGMERSTLALADVGTLLIDYYPEEFIRDEQEYGDKFLYISPDGGEAYMLVIFRQGQTAAAAASTFFDDAEPEQTTPGGAQSIGRTGLIGQYVMAKSGNETYEAWLVDVDDGIIAFSIKHSGELQSSALHSLIDTMRLTQ